MIVITYTITILMLTLLIINILILDITVQASTCWPGRCSPRGSSTFTSVVPQSNQSLFVTQL